MPCCRLYRVLVVAAGVSVVIAAFLLGRFTAPQRPPEVAPQANSEQPRAPNWPEVDAPARVGAPPSVIAHEEAAALSGVMGVWTYSISGGPPPPVPVRGSTPAPTVIIPPQPMAFSKLHVIDATTEKVVTQVTTDKDGRFRVILPPGRYYLDNPNDVRDSLRPTASFEVVAGRYSNVAAHTNILAP